MPPALKNDLVPIDILSIFLEDFLTEINDFPITIAHISVSMLLSHTGRPQEVFEKTNIEGKPKVIAFEFIWDTDITMEKVTKVIKCIPGNIQMQGFMEIASMVICSGSYYSSLSKQQENWKNNEKFADKEPISWVKIAWMMLAGLKYPNLVIFQRVEGYKSSANFITSLDFENLLRFAKKQDERSNIKPRNSEKSRNSEPKALESQPNSFPSSSLPQKYPYSRPQLDSKEIYSRPELNYPYTLDSKKSDSLENIQAEEITRKSQTPIHKKYDILEPKSESFDNRLSNLAVNEKVSRPSRFDIPKAPLRKDERGLERFNENYDKNISPRVREDSFRSWDKNEEMERIHLGSPKDKDFKSIRSSSRNDELQPKLSFTPQRNFSKEPEKLSHYSPKEFEKYQSSSPYFKEKISYKEKYSDILDDRKNKEPFQKEDLQGYEYKGNPVGKYASEGNLAREEVDYYQKRFTPSSQEDVYGQDNKFGLGPGKGYQKADETPYGEYSRKQELPPRSQKPAYENFEKDEGISRGFKGNYYKNEEDFQKPPVESYENPMDKYNYKDIKETRELRDEGRFKENKLLEEFYQREKTKGRELKNPEDNYGIAGLKPRESLTSQDSKENERFKPRDLKLYAEDQPKDGGRLDSYQDSYESNEFSRKNYKIDENERFKPKNYNFPEDNEIRGELKARDLNLNEDEQTEKPKDFRFQEENEQPKNFKFKDYSQEEPIVPSSEDPGLRKYQSLVSKDLYEKYKPGAYKKPEEIQENEYRSPSYNIDDEFNIKADYSRNKPEEYSSKYRDLNRFEAKDNEEQYNKGQPVREYYSGNEEKGSSGYGNFRKNEGNFEEAPKRISKEYDYDRNPGQITEETSKGTESNEFSDWNCAKCNKKVLGNSYECNDCRLINWDQFYKVKSLQHTRNRTEDVTSKTGGTESNIRDDPVKRLYSFSDNKEEHNEWVCANCKTSNKHLFFLCKSCRKPRNQVKDSESSENVRKEYKFTS